jgi:MFS family permease
MTLTLASVTTHTSHTDPVTSTADAELAQDTVLSGRYRALTLGIVSTVLLVAFEATAVNTAMPVAARALDGLGLYAFAFSGFFTASLLAMVVSGEWCDKRGPLGPLSAGISSFGAGLLVVQVQQSGPDLQAIGEVRGQDPASVDRPRLAGEIAQAQVLPGRHPAPDDSVAAVQRVLPLGLVGAGDGVDAGDVGGDDAVASALRIRTRPWLSRPSRLNCSAMLSERTVV